MIRYINQDANVITRIHDDCSDRYDRTQYAPNVKYQYQIITKEKIWKSLTGCQQNYRKLQKIPKKT